jgi:hypothetical protein
MPADAWIGLSRSDTSERPEHGTLRAPAYRRPWSASHAFTSSSENSGLVEAGRS